MTTDPFSSAAIASDVETYSFRRLDVRAKTIPLREMPSITSTAPSGNTSEVGGIAQHVAAGPTDRNGYPGGQGCTPARYRPATGDAAVALRLLRSVPEPLTTERVARALAWPKYKAKRWLARFAAKGVLVATGKGHAWAR